MCAQVVGKTRPIGGWTGAIRDTSSHLFLDRPGCGVAVAAVLWCVVVHAAPGCRAQTQTRRDGCVCHVCSQPLRTVPYARLHADGRPKQRACKFVSASAGMRADERGDCKA
jgi:hypothetical protein